jgi:hypothetical protein
MRWVSGVLAASAMVAAVLAPVAALGATSAAGARLPCVARMSDSRPADGATTVVRVKTTGKARVVAVAHFRARPSERKARASAAGYARLPFKLGKTRYGYRVSVSVDVYRGSRTGSCSTSFTPTAPRQKVYGIGSCRASGEFAVCAESGEAYHPLVIRVHVSASPDQSVLVIWSDACSVGNNIAAKSGQFTATTPVDRTIGHPFKHPDSCDVVTSGGLNESGSLHVWTNYTR